MKTTIMKTPRKHTNFNDSTIIQNESSTINNEPRRARGDGAARVSQRLVCGAIGSTTRPNISGMNFDESI